MGVRYGSKLGNNLFGWEFVKYFDRDGYNVSSTGSVANGSWDAISGGLEINRKVTERDYFTLQGNTYDGDEGNLRDFVAPPQLHQ